MSSFAKRGQRQALLAHRKKVKLHTKAFYRILGEMDVLSKQLDPSIEYTEETIDEYVLPIYGRELDSMEKMLILGKLHHMKELNDKINDNYVIGVDPYETEDTIKG